jgi:CRISPR-associated protein Cst2
MNGQPIYSLAISARAVINMHSLNNEGGEGNQITTRYVNVVRPDGNGGHKIVTVNAISGDMLKHIQAEHLWNKLQGTGPLCGGCRVFSSSRILDDRGFIANLPKQDSEAIDQLLQRCVIDDLEGTLVARGARSIPRKSVVEFGWVIGIPELTTTESYFHVRYALERGEPAEEATEQAIFHRPASSGVYGIVCKVEASRIGHNDILQRPTLDLAERQRRFRLLLESLRDTFLEPNGAMRGTQNPHITGLSGVITIARSVIPAPAWSPLADDYIEQIQGITSALHRINGAAVSALRFRSPSEFAELMADLISEAQPWTINATA